MAVSNQRGTNVDATNGTTWANTNLCIDGTYGTNDATYGTWTNATRSATGYINIGNFDFSAIPSNATINSVTVLIRHYESSTTYISAVTFQPYDGTTAIGSAFAATRATAARSDSTTFSPTLAQLQSANFCVRVNVSHNNSTTSAIFRLDYVDISVDYTVPGVSVDAECASGDAGTGIAYDATVSSSASPTLATGSSASDNLMAGVGASPPNIVVSGNSEAVSDGVGPNAGCATGTGTANDPAMPKQVYPGCAVGTAVHATSTPKSVLLSNGTGYVVGDDASLLTWFKSLSAMSAVGWYLPATNEELFLFSEDYNSTNVPLAVGVNATGVNNKFSAGAYNAGWWQVNTANVTVISGRTYFVGGTVSSGGTVAAYVYDTVSQVDEFVSTAVGSIPFSSWNGANLRLGRRWDQVYDYANGRFAGWALFGRQLTQTEMHNLAVAPDYEAAVLAMSPDVFLKLDDAANMSVYPIDYGSRKSAWWSSGSAGWNYGGTALYPTPYSIDTSTAKVSVNAGCAEGKASTHDYMDVTAASFEGGGTGSWVLNPFFGYAPAIELLNTAEVPAAVGNRELRVGWASSGESQTIALVPLSRMPVGTRAKARAQVYSKVGGHTVTFEWALLGLGANTNGVTGQWVPLETDWWPTNGADLYVALRSAVSGASEYAYVDDVQLVDELWESLGVLGTTAVTVNAGCATGSGNNDGAVATIAIAPPSIVIRLGGANLFTGDNVDFEGGTLGSWQGGALGKTTLQSLAVSSERAHSGTKSLKGVWATTPAAGGLANTATPDLVAGRMYVLGAWVYVPSGMPAVEAADVFYFSFHSPPSTLHDEWEYIVTPGDVGLWLNGAMWVGIGNSDAATAGQYFYVDDVLLYDKGVVPSIQVFANPTCATVTTFTSDGIFNPQPPCIDATGSAYDAVAKIGPSPSAATGTETAYNAGTAVTVNAGVATVTGTAYDAGTGLTVAGDIGTGTATANASTAALGVSGASVTATGVAYDVKSSVIADVANGTGTAYNISAAISITTQDIESYSTAYDLDVITTANPAPPSITITGAAYDTTISITTFTTIHAFHDGVWVHGALYRWDGADWVPAHVKRWTGTSWEYA